MRKLIFQVWISIDGYAADSNNTTSFFDQSPELNAESDIDLLQDMDNFDTILLGANTYKIFVDFWPNADHEIIAKKLNSIPKVVFSKKLTSAPWGNWPAAKLINGNVVEEITKLKNEPGKTIVLWGSISLAQALMQAGLIDEYHLRICPTALGSGRRLFVKDETMNFQLFGTKQYSSGLMLLQYRRI